jgi:GNAT superfamily N-acetyltransferase
MPRFCPEIIVRVIGPVRSRWCVVELREFGRDDEASIDLYVDIDNACRIDAPWVRVATPYRQRMAMTHGWDGEVGRYFLAYPEGADRPVGVLQIQTPEYDNLDLAWLHLSVRPDARRQGYGTAMMERALDVCRDLNRPNVGADSWDDEGPQAFAKALGFEQKSAAINRRQFVEELEPGLAERLYAEAEPHAADYELSRFAAPTPEHLLAPIAEATAAINDAPIDDLEVEDEVFDADRIRAYERAQLGSGYRVYRIIARHRTTGEIGGLTVATVDTETPTQGHQHDTSVVRNHRGHRLGLLLKADMMRWLAEAEPQVRTIDTWNAESNDHMIAINERLGYRVMGRGIAYQRRA